ncbi:MAG: phage holin family protein [Candidatus Pacebacteria bacterium]|nr:phage holin family protein [Candidatus Paceibacterota bacterium]
MTAKLIFNIISGILGIFLATKFVPNIEFNGSVPILIAAGTILGVFNFFIKPILKTITLPLRIITFGLFTLVINMFLIWVVVDILFYKGFEVYGIIPLLWTAVIVGLLNLIFDSYSPKRKYRY